MRLYFGGTAEGGVVVSSSRDGAVIASIHGTATADLLALLERVLKDAKAKKATVDEIAVDRGPGGFSVVRRRVAVATALARALGAKLAPVGELTPEEAAGMPSSSFKERAPVPPIYAGEPNITATKKKKTWTAR